MLLVLVWAAFKVLVLTYPSRAVWIVEVAMLLVKIVLNLSELAMDA